MKEASKIFGALGDPTRLGIIALLLGGEKCVCEIFPRVKRAQPTVSLQLSKLESWGIISSRRNGKNILYKIRDRRISRMCAIAGIRETRAKKEKC